MRAVLEPGNETAIGDELIQNTEQNDGVFIEEPAIYDAEEEDHAPSMNGSVHHQYTSITTTDSESTSEEPTLAHVFPFQTKSSPPPPPLKSPTRKDKRVSMDMRSLSSSSGYSVKSRTTTIDSRGSGVEGDTSIDKLSKTQDSSGDSVLMMAVEARQPNALKYLLTLNEFYPIQTILHDSNSEGTTLLSAAVQLAHTEMIEIILDFVFRAEDDRVIIDFFAKQDAMGRTVAHYLFNAPQLISRIGRMLPWRRKDRNGQTPLFALCRSYDHPRYSNMINGALAVATQTQDDGQALHLDDHVDSKGNTLLHVVNDSQTTLWILHHCDSDANATNDKRFTPLMVASKYGRIDMVRALFGDPRVDLYAKEHRGMTAVELAKDDEVRSRIDDLILFSNPAGADGRITTVVRSFFVEDATIRLILKSGAPNVNSTITVTTCRRSLSDFENLAKWLAVEHPASWLPSIFNFRSPFQISSRPARAVLLDIQGRLDSFLKIMLLHSTFSTHELLWEFFLVPEVQPEMMAERSRKKGELRAEKVKEEYEPVDVKDVELFVSHAREMVRGVNHLTKSVIRRVNKIRNTSSDLSDAQHLSTRALSTLTFLPESHITAFTRYSRTLHPFESDPYKIFHSDMHAISTTVLAILSALARPHSLIASMSATSKAIDRHTSSLRRSDRWPLGLLDDTRNKIHLEAAEKVEKSQEELRVLGSELRYTQQTVAGELAGWQDLHGRMGRRAIRTLVQRMVVREKDRLEGMKRAVRGVVDLTGQHSRVQGS
ncbi:MAG: hypothetical protein M1830_010222 [Pleopsidium flavum]|nr:MAG: hypothetical protein M1830_010222 [Pleopsidium flavum]